MKQKQQEFRHTPQKPDSGNDKQEARQLIKVQFIIMMV